MSEFFTILTWNLFKWKGVEVHEWPGERQKGMHATISSLRPDIICTQETAPEYLDTILDCNTMYKCIIPDDASLKANLEATEPVRPAPFLAKHLRYRRGQSKTGDVEAFPGWLEEGNIVWRSDKFDYVAHGAIDVGIEKSEARRPKRRLFYVKLFHKTTGQTVLVTTAHLTWEGGSGKEQMPPYFSSERCKQALNIVHELGSIAGPDDKVIFCGDMNDSWHVPFIMRDAGLLAYDFQLNLATEMTHPARPCFHEERVPSQTRDWIFSKNIRPILGRVCADMVLGLSRHPSDHFPVMCVYELEK
jgi:endonuclease/exonuclease/phosphatase family metal-dependent hydrolase